MIDLPAVELSATPDEVLTRRVVDAASYYYEVAPADVIGRSRTHRHAAARHMAVWLLRNANPLLSLPDMGRLLGGRDHTTILNSVQRAEALRLSDAAFRAYTDQALTVLRQQRMARIAASPWATYERDIQAAAAAAVAVLGEHKPAA